MDFTPSISGSSVFFKHGHATCAQRIECRANGVEYDLSIVRFCRILRTLTRDRATLSVFQVAKRGWDSRDPAASFGTIARPPSTCDPNPAPYAFCLAIPTRLIMTSPKPWLVLVMLTSKMLFPQIVEVRRL